jgi:hypothetical protein
MLMKLRRLKSARFSADKILERSDTLTGTPAWSPFLFCYGFNSISATTQQARQQLSFGHYIIKPDAMIFLEQCVDGCVHRAGSPDFARDLQSDWAVLVDRIPLVSDFQTLSCTIVSKALDTRILDGMMRHWERIEKVFTIHDPTPAVAEVRLGRPVVNLVRFSFESAGVHQCKFLPPGFGSLFGILPAASLAALLLGWTPPNTKLA